MEPTDIKTEQQKEETTAPRPWVTPTFERITLEEALSGTGKFTSADFATYAS